MPNRRAVLSTITALALARAAPAWAQAGSAKIINGFPAGGTVDTTSRRIAEAWRGRLGDQVLVENKVGAGGRIAVEGIKNAAPDGNTVLLSPASMMTIYPHVYRKLSYNPATDVTPVTPVCNYACAFVVGPAVPAEVKTILQFADWAKANPKLANFASPAAGSMPHFLGVQLAQALGVAMTHVPDRGSAPAIQDLLGGQVPSCMTVLGEYLPYLAGGKLRVLGVTSPERSRFMPDQPTFTELGMKPVTGVESYGLFLPPKTPAAIVDRTNDLARVALREKAVQEGLARVGFEPLWLRADEYAAQLARERAQWAPIVKASGFSSDD
jgi:tripartite-type tricarboxylate transporter receptor subunit TctC